MSQLVSGVPAFRGHKCPGLGALKHTCLRRVEVNPEVDAASGGPVQLVYHQEAITHDLGAYGQRESDATDDEGVYSPRWWPVLDLANIRLENPTGAPYGKGNLPGETLHQRCTEAPVPIVHNASRTQTSVGGNRRAL